MINSRKHWLHWLCAVLLAASSAQAFAYRCNKVEPPAIPTSADLSAAEMETLQKTVEAYLAEAEHYVGCTRRAKNANQTVDEMKLVAADYNVLVVLYKEKLQSKEAVAVNH